MEKSENEFNNNNVGGSEPEPYVKPNFSDFKDVQDPSWEGKTSAEKHFLLWKILCSHEREEEWYSLASSLTAFDLSATFNTKSDQMPDERPKTLHSAGGVVAEVSFVPVPGCPYTGLFQGAEFGIIRFSWMTQPTENGVNVPGMAIKFFRTNVHSGNIFALNDGIDDNNFYQRDFSNHCDLSNTGVGMSLLHQKFKSYTNYSDKTGLSDFAKFDEEGFLVEKPIFPFELQYRVQGSCRAVMGDSNPFRDGLQTCLQRACPVGRAFLEVFARSQPGTLLHPCGHIILTSHFTTSAFGDQKLFFQHTLFETDLKYRPSWEFVLTTTEAEYFEYLKTGHLDHVKLLCQMCPRFVNERITLSYVYAITHGYRGLTGTPYSYPLHVASREGHAEVVAFLLEKKADVNLQDNQGRTALQIAAKNPRVRSLLTDAKENTINQTQDITCPSVLFKALDDGKVELVASYIKQHPELVNSRCLLKRSYAFWYGTVLYGNYFTYPLHLAVYKEDKAMIVLLLQAGADPRFLDGWGRTAIDLNPEVFLDLKQTKSPRKLTREKSPIREQKSPPT